MKSKTYYTNQIRITSQKQEFLEQLKTVPIIQVACERLQISRATIYRWKDEDQEFSKQVDIAITQGSYLVNDLAESQLVSAIRDGELPAVKIWLNHNHFKYGAKSIKKPPSTAPIATSSTSGSRG